ncbi:type II secretion system F family protein [Auritidibacter ignavus]|uniref:type II secretion system F family protein n=1 Tax=Auritidibacter ignavus TaxID=678932 RepID=UPI00109D4A9A|nr:hypothetical protein [Auritidibacter ignavus]
MSRTPTTLAHRSKNLLATTPLGPLLGLAEPGELSEIIEMLRQAAALLDAGRDPQRVWSELALGYPACPRSVATDDTDPGCCLHHTLDAQQGLEVLAETPLQHVTGPGEPHYWQQISGSLELARDTGMKLSTLLSRLADALEAGEDVPQARQTAAAGPRSTATLLAWLPVAGMALSAMIGVTVFHLLLEPIGWVLLTTGIGLATLGRWWSQRLVKEAQNV